MQASTDAHNLEQAFAAFNAHSAMLEGAYNDLKAQVDQLTSELKRARDEQRRQRHERNKLASRLANLLDALPGGVLVLDADGVIVEHNPAAEVILGEPLDGVSWQQANRRAGACDDRGAVTLDNGRTVNVARRPLAGEPGEIVLLTDVTETRQLQARVERKERLAEMGEMAARIAHQIRTPLSSAMLYSTHLQRSSLDTDKRRRYAERTVARLQQIEAMVGDMLGFARGGQRSEERFNAAELLADVAEIVRPQTADGDLVEVVLPDMEIPVSGHREALLGALANLVNNALQAGEGDTTVRVATGRLSGGTAYFTVADNGPGMSPQTAERIFEPFFTTRRGGTGLGLAVVRATARAHGGDVTVESIPGHGTAFTLWLGPAPAQIKAPITHDIALAG